ncbi:P-loop NTPase fold protein [Capnocytophaga gingivalis]
MEENYPHFIVDKPLGEDFFEGQSQSKLTENISNYILKVDNKNTNKESLPRIIGIEGSWGSGKSNVVTKLDNKLKNLSYYIFTYDTWSHQEDLQRRSILETLTNRLIQDKVLQGEVSIKMRNGKLHTAKWSDQLQMLLSNKTTTITKSIPKFSWTAILGILLVGYFAVSSVVLNQLIELGIYFRFRWILVIELLPLLLVGGISLLYAVCKSKWEIFTTLLTQKNDNIIDEQFTSSEEPSITEFKNWIQVISDELDREKCTKKKVIIVFDNMDRLPSDKVVQLWSLIHTFFAGSDFKNIWTIIPFDYVHLCEAILPSEKKEIDKFKQFINKTFPIVFTVPKPVITDYRKLFNTLFEKAFGKNEQDKEHICQVFMCLEENPNPRTVICFINELVALRLQWRNEQFRLRNLALYILKKGYLLYNKEKSLEESLLSNELFDKVNSFYPQTDSVRIQLCQFAYGLEDEKLAGELPLRNVLLSLINNGNSISEYAESPHFVPVLESILTSTSITKDSLASAVKSFNSLDISNFNKKEQERLNKKWDALANMKSEIDFTEIENDETIHTLIEKVSENCAKRLLKSYCSKISKCSLTNGADYYIVLNNLQEAIGNIYKEIDIIGMLQERKVTPKIFEEYVNAAGENYPIFKVSTDNNQLNQYILQGTLENQDTIVSMFKFVLKDNRYDFNVLRNELSEHIEHWEDVNKEIRLPALVNRLLHDDDKILEIQFKTEIINLVAPAVCSAAWGELSKQGNEDIVAMHIANSYDIPNFEDKMTQKVSRIIEKYIVYADLIKRLGSSGTALYKINRYMIEHCIGEEPNSIYIAQNAQSIKNTLNITYEVLFKQFNKWCFKWDENDISSYRSYVHEPLFEDYKHNRGNFIDGLITLAVKAMEEQSEGFLTSDSYWISFVKVFLGTQYLPSTNKQLTEELKQQLDYVIEYGSIRDEELLNCLISNSPDASLFISYLNDKMSTYFAQNDVTSSRFQVFGKLLPKLEKSITTSTCIGLIEHFIKPVYRETKCAEIITSNHDFYLYVFEVGATVAHPILTEMLASEMYEPIHKEIETLINAEKKDSSKNNI